MKTSLLTIGIIIITVLVVLHLKKEVQEPIPPITDGPQGLNTDQLKDSLDRNKEWIDNCDQKSGILLGTIGVAITVLLTSDVIKVLYKYIFHPIVLAVENPETMDFNYARMIVLLFFLTVVIMASLSLYFLAESIKPNIDYDKIREQNPAMAKKSYLFYGSVANMTYDEFREAKIDYDNDLRSQVYATAKIAFAKFQNFLNGFFWFKLMMLSALFLFLSIMFL